MEGEAFSAREIIETLSPVILEARKKRLHEVIERRTYTVTPVLEGLYDHGNVNAVIRSAEALGFQSMHVIDSSEKFKAARRVSQGAEKWLDITTWEDTAPCVRHLKGLGYRIVATHFEDAQPIQDFAFDTPTAIVFGNEHAGLSPQLLEAADARMVIPMAGFSQSFNISVAAALCLYHVAQDRVRRMGAQGDLDAQTREVLTASYYLRSAPAAEKILLERRGKSSCPEKRESLP